MTSTDLFQQRVQECRRLADAARNRKDKAFWLGLVERWQGVESRSAQRLQEHNPGGEGRRSEMQRPPGRRRSILRYVGN
jgi:hypothetical protein